MTKPNADSIAVDAMDIEVEEDCPLCCNPYNNAQYERSRVVCSAENGCATFSMCRLCVFRQDMQLRERPFVVNDDTGDFVQLDPTVCPQCKRPGAFLEGRLPPLSEEIKRAEEKEVCQRREEATQRQRERAVRLLDEAPRAFAEIARDSVGESAEGVDLTHHERIKIISGDRHPNQFIVDERGDHSERCAFVGSTTIGVPDLLTSTGIVYYEILMKEIPPFYLMPKIQFGFSLADGMEIADSHSEVCVGDNAGSWGFDGFSGNKIHIERFGDERLNPKWGPDEVVGIAANVDKGMIAVSLNGDWQLSTGNGVKFEDESIKMGVYPCISGKNCALKCIFGPNNFKHAPPPTSLWDIWPKFEDSTWLGITEEARAAAMMLGYTQQSWMGSGNPIEQKSWIELSSEEQFAANALGYNAAIWKQLTTLWAEELDGNDDDVDDDDDDSTTYTLFTTVDWDDLPNDARLAAETLGYTRSTWMNGEGPLDDKVWDQLTVEQQRAAIVIGYDEESWNEDSDSVSSDSESSDDDSSDENGSLPFDHMSWHDLPKNAREAAEKLGHTAESWDHNTKSSWDDTCWEELPLEQQFAASVLGYDASKWNSAIEFAHNLASVVFLGRPL